MKKVTAIILFFMFLGSSFELIADSEPKSKSEDVFKLKSLDEIFSSYMGIVAEFVNTEAFFKNWNNLEYFKFLSRINDLYIKKDIIHGRSKKILISSELTEIFGGLFLQNEVKNFFVNPRTFLGDNGIVLQDRISDKNIYYIPENLLDSLEKIQLRDILKNRRRHDGVLVKIEGEQIIIYKILEAKLKSERYESSQSRAVLTRWLHEGIYIAGRRFAAHNIKVQTATGVISLDSYCSESLRTNDFEDLVKVYDIENIKNSEMYIIDSTLSIISGNIVKEFFSEGYSDFLDKINADFIDRILYLLRKYIQIYNRIPSLSNRKALTLYLEHQDPISEEDILYFENDQNRKDLILTLYSIYRDNVLFSIFKERIFNFFTLKEVENLSFKINRYDKYTHVYLLTDMRARTIYTLLELLGEEHKTQILETVNKYYMSTQDPREDLIYKYKKLYRYFMLKYPNISGKVPNERLQKLVQQRVNDIILSHLESFVMINEQKMDIYLCIISGLNLTGEESYEIMKKYFNFYKIDCLNLTPQKIAYVRQFIGYKKSDFEVVCFIFDTQIEERDIYEINGERILRQLNQRKSEEIQSNSDCIRCFTETEYQEE